ncbi:MAG: hypothetical protein WC691_03985 [Sulfuricurvum sp.]|jgi:hypothetical protein
MKIKKEAATAITTESVIDAYMCSINNNLQEFSDYENTTLSIDFLKMRRFLITTYNTLIDLDLELKQSIITDILKELNVVTTIYDSFQQKSKQIKRAFHDLFLNCHDDFVKAQYKLESNKLAIGKHSGNITKAEATIAKLTHIFEKTSPTSPNFILIQEKIKKVRTIATDEIHHKRTLEVANIGLIQFTEMIKNENEESFTVKYRTQAKIINQKIIALLNKMAFRFEASLWEKARQSKRIKNHFRESEVKGKLCSLTYLKYYLQSLDKEKLSQSHRELITLLPYIENLHRRFALYFSIEIDNAIRLKTVISSIDKYIDVESTFHYDKTIASIMKQVPDFIFIDQQHPDLRKLIKALKASGIIQKINVVLVVETMTETYLSHIKKHNIRYLLPTEVTSRIYSQTLTHILDEN